MELPSTADSLIRQFARELRVITLGGVAVISHGLSRNTHDADVWLEPFETSKLWADKVSDILSQTAQAKPVMIGSWKPFRPEEFAEIAEAFGVFRVEGLDRPLDVFRKPNQFQPEQFDEVWERGKPLDDGTRLPDVIDLLVTKQDTGRTKDTQDIIYLENLAQEHYLAELPTASAERAVAMLERFLTPAVAEAALHHASEPVRLLGRRFLLELAADGDPFAAQIVRERQL